MSEKAEDLGYRTEKVRRREDLQKQDIVDVVQRYGPDGSMIKRKEARVIDVLRKAAILDIEGENATRTVRFAELEVRVPTPVVEKRRTTGSKRKRPPAPAPVPVPAVVVSAEPLPPAEPAPKSEPPTMGDWLASGVKIQEQLILKSHAIENEIGSLREKQRGYEDKAIRLAEEANGKQKELDALRAQIELMDTLRGSIG